MLNSQKMTIVTLVTLVVFGMACSSAVSDTIGNEAAERVGIESVKRTQPTVEETGRVAAKLKQIKQVQLGSMLQSAELYNNGPLISSLGTGVGGADESILQTSPGLSILGFGHQLSAGNRIADDFTITESNWLVRQITFYAYQTGAVPPSTITSVNLQIWDGPPNDPASNVVWGDTTTNRLVSSNWSGVYRVEDSGSGVNTQRYIMTNTVEVNTKLLHGTYWLDWQVDGSPSFSGPWAPPITITGETTTGNALQSSGGTWANVYDGGTNTPQGFPFIIYGESFSWLLMTVPITSGGSVTR